MRLTCARIILFGLLFSILGFLGYLLVTDLYNDYQARQERENLHEEHLKKYGDELMSMCKNVDAAVNADFPVFENPPRLLVLERNSDYAHVWHESQANYPENTEQVDLIICADGEGKGQKVEIERCPYEGTSSVVIRYRLDPQVIALSPSTGEVVAAATIPGGEVGGCPFSIPDNSKNREVVGQLPDASVLVNWVDEQNRQSTTRQIFGDSIMGLCENPPSQTSANPLSLDDPPKLLLLDIAHNTAHQWQAALPVDWQAASPDELDAVVCISRLDNAEAEITQTGTCNFTTFGSGGQTITGTQEVPLYLRSLHVVVLDPETGDVLAIDGIEGYTSGCPFSIGADEFDGIYSNWPTVNTFQTWFSETLLP